MRYPLLLIVFFSLVLGIFTSFVSNKGRYLEKNIGLTKDKRPSFWEMQENWSDSVIKSLSVDERIGQLFMIAAYSNKEMKHVREVRELIQKYNIGGLIFMQGGPGREPL